MIPRPTSRLGLFVARTSGNMEVLGFYYAVLGYEDLILVTA